MRLLRLIFPTIVFFVLLNFANAQSSDPGQDSSLFLQSGNVNGQSISPSSRIVTVNPGQTIAGTATLVYNSAWPTNINTPFGVTRSWGAPETGFNGFGNAQGSASKTVSFSYVAPSTPGTYHLIFAYRAEVDYGDVFSMTNWAYNFGEKWGDGNDIASWSQNMINSANADGKVMGQMLGNNGYQSVHVPATAIVINVAAPECIPDPTETKTIQVSSETSWNDAGLNLLSGDKISISASGNVGWDNTGATTGPNGPGDQGGGCNALVTNSNVPSKSLVGNIAESANLDGKGFFVGSSFCGTVPISGTTAQSGKLLLGFNDNFVKCDRSGLDSGAVSDNSGSFTATIKVKRNPNNPDPSDPGGTSSLTLTSGTINGQSISSSQREIVVRPGNSIAGAVNLEYISTWGSNAVMAFGATPNWGDHASSYMDYGSVNTPASGTKSVNVNAQAPSQEGTYYIILAYRAEYTAGQVFSMTNWPYGSNVWNDGNDIADWSLSQINAANSNGRAIGSILTTQGYKPFWVPATAIKVTVSNANINDPGQTSWLRLSSGNLNGQSINPSSRAITVDPGQQITGSVNFNYNSTYGSNAVMVFASTPNWGDHQSQCRYQSSVSTPAIGTLGANINTAAPTAPGTYHILFQYRGEFNEHQVCSMTNWAAQGGNSIYNDGNDVSDWSQSIINDAKGDGNTLATILHADGYRPWYVPANAIDVIVRAPTQDVLYRETFDGSAALPSGWSKIPGFDQGSFSTQLVNGVLRVTGNEQGNIGLGYFGGGLSLPENYTLTARLRLAQRVAKPTSDQALVFVNLKDYSATSNQQYLEAGWRQNQNDDFFITGSGTAYDLGHITAPFNFVEGNWHSIKLVKKGNQFQLFINEIPGLDITLPAGISGGTIGLQLSQGIFEIDEMIVTGKQPPSQTGACFNKVNDLPVTCKSSTLTQDTKSGCRTIQCSSGSNSVKIGACEKTDSQGRFFEIYRQSFTGTPPEVCLSNDCLKSGWGYKKGSYFPICTSTCTPSAEICDSKDNDCDSQVDEGNVCSTPKPDVTPTQLSGSSSLTTGQNSPLVNTAIKNQGNEFAGGGWLARVFLSKDNQITKSDAFIGEFESASIPAGDTHTTGRTFHIPFNVPEGSYFYGITLDEINELPESNDGNNIMAGNQVQVSRPSNFCYGGIRFIAPYCNGGRITSDTTTEQGDGGVCRQITCRTPSNNEITALACDVDNGNPDYFDITRTGMSASPPEICLGGPCVSASSGFARSTDYPDCSNPCTPSTEVCDSADNDCDGQIDEGNVCGSTCHSSVKTIPATCTSTITQNTISGNCRTIQCGSGSNTIKVLACDKPDSGTKTHFEMYRQSYSGSPPKVCFASTCIQTEGYKKSPSYPICT